MINAGVPFLFLLISKRTFEKVRSKSKATISKKFLRRPATQFSEKGCLIQVAFLFQIGERKGFGPIYNEYNYWKD
jgi:hypothetical protein